MKKFLILTLFMLSNFTINADEVELSCPVNDPSCNTCPEYQTLFPIEKFSKNQGSLDIEADKSEILEEKYILSGNVEVNSESLYLSANDVDVYTSDNSILATGNVKFQDESYLITSDLLSASRENDTLTAIAENANYQDYSVGLRGANGYTERIEKTSSSVLLTNATYSLCPINENDWLIEADQIELKLDKNRGVADNAFIKFYGVPIFYTPKHSWVLSGRGSGFLTPDYSSYNEPGQTDDSYSLRVPYYINLAPDRDLLVALTYMSSRGFNYEGKYRQLIPPLNNIDTNNSKFEIETRYLNEDKINNLQRWLLKFNQKLDLNDKTHFTAQYYRVSDPKYFEEVARTNTNIDTINSFLKINYNDNPKNLTAYVLTEDVQAVNGGAVGYVRALEVSSTKEISIGQKEVENFNKVKSNLDLSEDEEALYLIDNPIPITTNLALGLVTTNFKHDTASKESGIRTHGNINISRRLNIRYPLITPSVGVTMTNYSLKNSPNINRTIFGAGLGVDFTINNRTRLLGFEVNNQISPKITYSYRGKVVQGNIPIFDTTDKYDDILSFAALTSGERYTGLDRITNANDITLSLESNYKLINKISDDEDPPDLLSLKMAQSFYTDDEVVSDKTNTNYETRKSYSDIAASIDFALNKYRLSSAVQFNPDRSKIVRRENTLSYQPSSRKFLSLNLSDDGTTERGKIYGAYPLTDEVHLFGGLDKTLSSGVTNSEATGIAYESCCWAYRLAHFKDSNSSGGYSYSTGMEIVLTGLGSTSSPLKGRIESNIPGYSAKLR